MTLGTETIGGEVQAATAPPPPPVPVLVGGVSVSFTPNGTDGGFGLPPSQPFTVTSAKTITRVGYYAHVNKGVKVGTRIGIIADGGATTWLGSATATEARVEGGWYEADLDTPVLLQTGVTYRFAVSDDTATITPSPEPNGIVGSVGYIYYSENGGANYATAYVQTARLPFRLYETQVASTPATVGGPVSTLVSTAPAGAVVGMRSAVVQGLVATLVSNAPAGMTSAVAAVAGSAVGVASTLAVTAPAGTAEGVAGTTDPPSYIGQVTGPNEQYWGSNNFAMAQRFQVNRQSKITGLRVKIVNPTQVSRIGLAADIQAGQGVTVSTVQWLNGNAYADGVQSGDFATVTFPEVTLDPLTDYMIVVDNAGRVSMDGGGSSTKTGVYRDGTKAAMGGAEKAMIVRGENHSLNDNLNDFYRFKVELFGVAVGEFVEEPPPPPDPILTGLRAYIHSTSNDVTIAGDTKPVSEMGYVQLRDEYSGTSYFFPVNQVVDAPDGGRLIGTYNDMGGRPWVTRVRVHALLADGSDVDWGDYYDITTIGHFDAPPLDTAVGVASAVVMSAPPGTVAGDPVVGPTGSGTRLDPYVLIRNTGEMFVDWFSVSETADSPASVYWSTARSVWFKIEPTTTATLTLAGGPETPYSDGYSGDNFIEVFTGDPTDPATMVSIFAADDTGQGNYQFTMTDLAIDQPTYLRVSTYDWYDGVDVFPRERITWSAVGDLVGNDEPLPVAPDSAAGPAATVLVAAHAGWVGEVLAHVEGVAATLAVDAPAGEAVGMVIDRSGGVPTMTLSPSSIASPGAVFAQVISGVPRQPVAFYLGVNPTPVATGFLNEAGSLRIQIPIEVSVVGEYQIGFSINGAPTTFVPLQVTEVPQIFTPMAPGVEPPMPQVVEKWVFQAYDFTDVNAVEEWVLPLNPRTISRSFGELSITSEPTTVSNGRVISWEGAPKPATWTWSGHLLDEESYREMLRWAQTGQRFYVTDHWGTRYLVKVASFDIKRKRDIERSWHHTYDMQAYVLDGPGVIR